ncbi:hypothetical protein J6590_017957 [Homalodisca vitripennis]|nr:hypothetical protein J6590_017957 [Homalodisca vitripennis]
MSVIMCDTDTYVPHAHARSPLPHHITRDSAERLSLQHFGIKCIANEKRGAGSTSQSAASADRMPDRFGLDSPYTEVDCEGQPGGQRAANVPGPAHYTVDRHATVITVTFDNTAAPVAVISG